MMIFTLISNEIKKLMMRKKTIIVFAAFILLTIAIGYGVYRDEQNRKQWSSPEFRMANLEESIKMRKQDMDNPNASAENKSSGKEEIANMEQELANIKLEKSGKTVDWKSQLKENIDSSQKILNDNNSGMVNNEKDRMKLELQKSKYLYDNNIKPEEGNKLNALNFIQTLFGVLGTIFIALGVMVFTGDMVSGEFTPPTMKILLTQPVSRAKVLASKFIAVAGVATLLILVVEILSFVIMGLIFGFGNAGYPVIAGTIYKWDLTQSIYGGHPIIAVAGSSYIMTTGNFVIRMFLMQTLFIITCVSVGFMLSSIVKSSMVSVSLSIVIVVALTILVQMPALNKVAQYMFTSYGDIGSVLSGDAVMRFANPNPNVTTAFGIATLIVTSVVSYLIAHIVFTKKDILI
ncbi:ABC transporter permease [Clostridium lacusfryxellense]|uniref:ABC transporter permease n=1 Tax=Clostridium lacusfryxellense TaxID=205328 RepID=UPI001C0DDDFA|nr:ABC transporter permease subunit [Clostridium lacusfryxellense]MBU3112466.1 ABC transporter permease subunit [Clostridium lacusfryxellense]